jgi:hypothetical protein
MSDSRNNDLAVSDHDEPIVLDNGPLRIDVGRDHLPTPSDGGKTWKREFTNFRDLLILTELKAGETPRVTLVRKLTGKSITLTVAEEMKPGIVFDTITIAEDGNKVKITAGSPLENDDDNPGIIVPKDKRKLRLTEIFVNNQSVEKFVVSNTFTCSKVSIVLIPKS